MASTKTAAPPRTIRTTSGEWFSRKSAEKLVRRGRARWHGPLIEIIPSLAPAELSRSLGRTARPKNSPKFPVASPRINPRWSDLRRALPVVPEVR